jgi:hypothetical protein
MPAARYDFRSSIVSGEPLNSPTNIRLRYLGVLNLSPRACCPMIDWQSFSPGAMASRGERLELRGIQPTIDRSMAREFGAAGCRIVC